MSYREARALVTLHTEINAAAPDRSTRADGWIGDPAHAIRNSDHNPNPAGVVRARDFTHDPAGGLDCKELAQRLAFELAAGTHPALGSGAYVIWDWRIISADRIREGWRTYRGVNGHRTHLHLSVARAAVGYDSTRPWNVTTRKDHLDMDETTVRAIVREEVREALRIELGNGDTLRKNINKAGNARDLIKRVETKVDQLLDADR